jgi:hypothetical protein
MVASDPSSLDLESLPAPAGLGCSPSWAPHDPMNVYTERASDEKSKGNCAESTEHSILQNVPGSTIVHD